MANLLPSDPVLLEQTLRTAVISVFASVPLIVERVKLYDRERFIDNRKEDLTASTVADPQTPGMRMTSILQIGIPQVSEEEYSGGCSTQLSFLYPIKFDMTVKDLWASPSVLYDNSSDLYMAIYMLARNALKQTRDLGYANCLHSYLQHDNVEVAVDEETGSMLHVGDWSLGIECTGVLV